MNSKRYAKPELVRFGSFRELTQIGWGIDGDGGILGIVGITDGGGVGDGCEVYAGGDCSRS